jgi:hypothetical protein
MKQEPAISENELLRMMTFFWAKRKERIKDLISGFCVILPFAKSASSMGRILT